MDSGIFIINLAIIGTFTFFILSFIKEEFLTLSREVKEDIRQEYLWHEEQSVKKYWLTRLLFPINKKLVLLFNRQKLKDRLGRAGIDKFPEDFLGIKEILLTVAAFVAYAVMLVPVTPVSVGVIFIIGWCIPDIIVNSKIKKRRTAIVRELPDAIDLLNLCVGGGLNFMTGIRWVVERSKPSPLMKEFSEVDNQVKMGKTRQESLRSMSKKLAITEVSSFTNALVHADRMGTPISEVLTILAEEARRQRFQVGRRQALKAPIKMLFPLIVFILPVVAVIVGGPILLQFQKTSIPAIGQQNR